MTEEELNHFGILGMHWGKKKAKKTLSPHKDYSIADAIRKKDISEMGNEELKTLTSRLQLEKSYRDVSKKEVSRGKQFVNNFIETFAKQQLTAVLSSLATKGIAAVGTGATVVAATQVFKQGRRIGF